MSKTKDQISYNMKQVKNKDSKIEILLRKELWKRGLRYRKNTNKVFGHPDIAFIGKKIAVFCDSEFWHGFNWEDKKKVNTQLNEDGWTVLRFWGKDIKKDTAKCADIIEKAVRESD